MKRKVAIFMAVVAMALSLNTVYAEDLGSDVKNAVLAAKSKLYIDEQYDEFHYETQQAYNRTLYELVWENDDYQQYRAVIDSDGDVQYYSAPSAYGDYGILSQTKSDDAQITAESFIKKVMPQRADKLELIEKSDDSASFIFKYAEKINGIIVLYDDTEVRVSKKTGEVISFLTEGKYLSGLINSKADDLTDEEGAKNAFIENGGIKLIYKADFDYKTKKAEVSPVYKCENISINAHNLNPVKVSLYADDYLSANKMFASGSSADAKSEEAADIVNLSEKELEMIEKTDGFITADQALASIKKYNILKNDFTYTENGLRTSPYNKDEYFWNFSASASDELNADISVDALSGKIVSFSLYKSGSEENNKALSEDEAKNKMKDYLRLLGGEYLNDVDYSAEVEYRDYSNRYTLKYNRKINNLELDSNYIRIQIDAETGELCGFEKVWYNDIELSPKQVKLTQKDAFDVYAKNADFRLGYAFVMNDSNGKFDKADAVYTARKNFNYYIDAQGGELVNYWSYRKDDEKPQSYTDIDASKYKDIINILFESGFYLEREEFKPNEPITYGDFVKLLYSGLEEKAYQRSITKKSVDEYIDENSLTDADMTKNGCARLLMLITGCDYLADKDEIFSDIYTDVDPKDRAEVNFAVSQKLLSAEEDKFLGNSKVTNEEAANIIYNLISDFWQNKAEVW